MTAVLTWQKVKKSFHEPRSITVLKDFSLDLMRGEFTALLGPSGCGKTTLLRLAAGLDYPDVGHVRYRDEPSGAWSAVTKPERSRAIMFQDSRLFPWLTVAKNVHLNDHSGRTEDVLRSVGLQDFSKSYPHQLSGGMARRVALARALVGDPHLLVLDEPFSNLDLPVRRELQQILLDTWQQRFCCLLVTHELEEALVLAERIVVVSPRPAMVLADERVPLEYPRDRRSRAYQEVKQKIQEAMKGWYQ